MLFMNVRKVSICSFHKKKKKKEKKIHLKIFTLKDRINAATKIYIRLNVIFFVGYINN